MDDIYIIIFSLDNKFIDCGDQEQGVDIKSYINVLSHLLMLQRLQKYYHLVEQILN